jgi:hypothetical protein
VPLAELSIFGYFVQEVTWAVFALIRLSGSVIDSEQRSGTEIDMRTCAYHNEYDLQ